MMVFVKIEMATSRDLVAYNLLPMMKKELDWTEEAENYVDALM
jgi:hypothetical protein